MCMQEVADFILAGKHSHTNQSQDYGTTYRELTQSWTMAIY